MLTRSLLHLGDPTIQPSPLSTNYASTHLHVPAHSRVSRWRCDWAGTCSITVLQCALMFSMHGPRLVPWAMLMLLVAAFLWLCHSYSSNSAKGYSKNKPHKPVPSADYSHRKGPELARAEFPPPHHSSAEWGKLVGMGWKEVGIFTPQVPTTKPAFPRHITGDQLKAKAICIDALCLCTAF